MTSKQKKRHKKEAVKVLSVLFTQFGEAYTKFNPSQDRNVQAIKANKDGI